MSWLNQSYSSSQNTGNNYGSSFSPFTGGTASRSNFGSSLLSSNSKVGGYNSSLSASSRPTFGTSSLLSGTNYSSYSSQGSQSTSKPFLSSQSSALFSNKGYQPYKPSSLSSSNQSGFGTGNYQPHSSYDSGTYQGGSNYSYKSTSNYYNSSEGNRGLQGGYGRQSTNNYSKKSYQDQAPTTGQSVNQNYSAQNDYRQTSSSYSSSKTFPNSSENTSYNRGYETGQKSTEFQDTSSNLPNGSQTTSYADEGYSAKKQTSYQNADVTESSKTSSQEITENKDSRSEAEFDPQIISRYGESYFCKVCQCSMRDKDSLNRHLPGMRHKRNIAESSKGTKTPLIPVEPKAGPAPGYGGAYGDQSGSNDDPIITQGNEFFCQVCRCSMRNEESRDRHLNGIRHRKTMEEFKQFQNDFYNQGGGTGYYNQPPGSNGPQGVSELEIYLQKVQGPVVGLDFIVEAANTGPNGMTVFECHLCEVYCNDKTIVPHILGLKHLSYYWEYIDERDFRTYYSQSLPPTEMESIIIQKCRKLENMCGPGHVTVKPRGSMYGPPGGPGYGQPGKRKRPEEDFYPPAKRLHAEGFNIYNLHEMSKCPVRSEDEFKTSMKVIKNCLFSLLKFKLKDIPYDTRTMLIKSLINENRINIMGMIHRDHAESIQKCKERIEQGPKGKKEAFNEANNKVNDDNNETDNALS